MSKGGVRILVVPRKPGPLLDPHEAARERPLDEIDALVDDLFGPEPVVTAGKLDVVLVALGLGLAAWAEIDHRSRGLTVLGAISVFLGLVLPIRSAWRALRRRSADRRLGALSANGLVLDVTDPLTRRLADAYAALLAALPGAQLKPEAASAGLMAVTEVAVLLGGGSPSTAADAEYIGRRITAIEKLTESLRLQGEVSRRAAGNGRPADGLERRARAEASEELEALGISLLHELDALSRQLEAGRGVVGS